MVTKFTKKRRMEMAIQVLYKGWECDLDFGKYGNGQTAITLFDLEDGEPVSTATVAVRDSIGSNEVVIKDYSENEGMLEVLQKAGVVSEPKRVISSGYVDLFVCDLLVDVDLDV
jgi:hypothetical protein